MKKKPLEYALYLLELRDRTEGEIREKMKRKEYEPEEIEKAVDFLKDKEFIDDERFVKRYIENKQSFGTAGKYKIRQKLMLLHLDSKLIEDNLAGINPDAEYERALEMTKDWLRKNKKKLTTSPDLSLVRRGTYEKVGRHLVSQGYEYDIVKRVLEVVLKPQNTDNTDYTESRRSQNTANTDYTE